MYRKCQIVVLESETYNSSYYAILFVGQTALSIHQFKSKLNISLSGFYFVISNLQKLCNSAAVKSLKANRVLFSVAIYLNLTNELTQSEASKRTQQLKS